MDNFDELMDLIKVFVGQLKAAVPAKGARGQRKIWTRREISGIEWEKPWPELKN